MGPQTVSAVIPSRGDVDTSGIVAHLRRYCEIRDVRIVVGDTPYNRYVAAADAACDVIFTQDDDCITELRPLLDAYQSGCGLIVNAMTPQHAAQYPGRQTLLGFGALFDKAMLQSLDGWERDALFYRESDRIFATINPHRSVFPEITILPWASSPNRLWMQPDHLSAKRAIGQRIFESTGIVS